MIKQPLFAGITLFLFLFMISCASPRQASDSASKADSSAPGWYPVSSEFSQSADDYTAYGMAIGADSSTAIRRAIAKAQSNMEQHISSALETARSEASERDSQLEAPSFIFALRKAEAALADKATVSRRVAAKHLEYGSYYGYAEVTVTKKALVSRLDPVFGSNRDAWDTLKGSAGLGGN